ncbi:hypothetical protein BGZ60DRAFT_421011 [Tricladium varicosporioides]|nr:hypothetical protein BGZ60DRAFT_421011 [Hymenoscyphus varicosporioides]
MHPFPGSANYSTGSDQNVCTNETLLNSCWSRLFLKMVHRCILRKVWLVDPEGNRTLGIITKPDKLPARSGSESKFLELVRNEDVFFKLG